MRNKFQICFYRNLLNLQNTNSLGISELAVSMSFYNKLSVGELFFIGDGGEQTSEVL